MKLSKNKKGMTNYIAIMIGVLVVALLAVTLIPTITDTISDKSGCFSATEYALLGLTGLLLIVGFVMLILKATGVHSKK